MAGGGRDVRLTVIEETKGDGLKKAGRDLDEVGNKADRAGKSFGELEKSTARIDTEINKTRESIRNLAQEFERTGDIDIFKKVRTERGNLTTLTKLKKDLEDEGDDAGKGFARRFLDSVSGGFSGDIGEKLRNIPGTLRGSFIAGLVGLAVAAAPALGAAVSAAVVGGTGLGGIIGGIALAAKDPAVGATAAELGNHLGDELTRASSSFRAPIIESLRLFDDELTRLEPRLTGIFDNLSPHVTNLAKGVIDGIDRLSGSIENTVSKAGPVIDEIARDIPILADGIGQFMDKVTDGAPGAVQFLHDFSIGARNLLSAIGAIVDGLSHMYDFLRSNPLRAIFVGPLVEAFNNLTMGASTTTTAFTRLNTSHAAAAAAAKTHAAALAELRLGADLTAEDFGTLSNRINQTVQTSDALAGQMVDKVINSLMGMDQATLGVAESQTQLDGALKRTGIDMDIHHEKSQQMREAVLSVVAANLRQYDTMIAAGASAQDAAAAYDANTRSLEDQLHTAHFTSAQIDDLIGKYRHVPDNVNTAITTEGLTEAIGNLANIIEKLNHIDGRHAFASVTVTTEYQILHGPGSTTYNQQVPSAARLQRYGGVRYADTGLVNLDGMAGLFAAGSSPTYGFAEPGTGGEAFIARNAPHAASLRYADIAARWHGGMVVPQGYGSRPMAVSVDITVRDDAGRQLEVLRREVDIRGGDVQKVLGRRGR